MLGHNYYSLIFYIMNY